MLEAIRLDCGLITSLFPNCACTCWAGHVFWFPTVVGSGSQRLCLIPDDKHTAFARARKPQRTIVADPENWHVADGPRGFSLSEAARLAGVSVGAPYRHFADKEALFSEIAAQGFVELFERIEAAAQTSPDDPRKRLVAIGMAYVQSQSRGHPTFR